MRWLFSKWMFLFMVNCIFLLCFLLGARWHHDYIFMLFIRTWQTQDVNSYMIVFPRSWVDSYMISFPKSRAYHYMFINTHYWNEIKSTRPWWRWWSDTLWMTFTRLWPTYSYHVYFGFAKNDTKWLPSKYFIRIPSTISSIILFCPYVLLDNKTYLVRYKNIVAIAIFMSCIWKTMECYGGWKLLLKWHANANVYIL
jgi:hypothetical protein